MTNYHRNSRRTRPTTRQRKLPLKYKGVPALKAFEEVPVDNLNMAKKIETVNHPSHYGGDTIYEAIKVIEAWDLTFNTGNAAKYICRAGKKLTHEEVSSTYINEKRLEDLRKAVRYLEFEIARLSK